MQSCLSCPGLWPTARRKETCTYPALSEPVRGKGEKVSFTDVTGTYERTVREAPDMVFSAEFGYFITHNCALRSAVSYGLKRKSTTTISRDEKSTVNAYAHFFSFSPAVSYYARICDKFYYRPGAVLSFGAVKEIFEGDDVPELAEMPFVFGISFEPAAFEVRPIKQMGIILKVGACDIPGSKIPTILRAPDPYRRRRPAVLFLTCPACLNRQNSLIIKQATINVHRFLSGGFRTDCF